MSILIRENEKSHLKLKHSLLNNDYDVQYLVGGLNYKNKGFLYLNLTKRFVFLYCNNTI